MAGKASLKHIQINKANSTMVIAIGVSAFVVVFSLVASRALWNKMSYQNRIIKEKQVAVDQIKQNLDTVDELVVAYKAFVGTPDNVIGGSPNGSGEKDGDNAKITLDALPSKYDFPALATSLEKILTPKYTINSIAGIDEEVTQTAPVGFQPVEMPFELTATSNFNNIEDLLGIFERSIRPIKASTIEITGTNADLQILLTAKTYFQPEKTLNVQTKVVK